MFKLNAALKYLIASLWFAIAFLWPFDLWQENREDNPTSEEGLYRTALTDAPLGMLKVNFFESENNHPRWNVRSHFGEMHRANNYASLKEVDADFISEKTGNVVNTQSDFGTSYLDKRTIDLKGNVMIHSKRGYLFTMDTLSYDGKTHFFNTEDFVTIKGPMVKNPNMILRGTGLNGNIDEEHFLLRKNVTAEKKLKTSDWLRIQSNKGEFFTEKQEAIFLGKVNSQMPKLGLKSDKLEVNMGEEESIRASGNVSLKRKDTTGKAEVVYMEMDSNKIILEGQAEVLSKNNLITGKRITLYSDEERIEVEEAQGKIKR